LVTKIDSQTIGAYLDYQKNHKDGDEILFLFDVDLDIKDCKDQYKGLAKYVPNDFLNHVKEGLVSKNMLDYTGMILPGIEFPQMYFKVKGCLTPPHQETLSFLSYNLNFGPDTSTWYFVSENDYDTLVALLKEKNLNFTGLNWWPKIDELQESNIIVKEYAQKPGDLVVVGPGTIHWVISNGVCTHVSWNQAPLHQNQLGASLRKYERNKADKNNSLIHLVNTLFMTLKRANLDAGSPIFENITKVVFNYVQYCSESIKYLQSKQCDIQYMDSDCIYGVNRDQFYFCSICEREIFNLIFVEKNSFSKKNGPNEQKRAAPKSIKDDKIKIKCFECAKKNFDGLKILAQKRIGAMNIELAATRICDANFQTSSCLVLSDRQKFCVNCLEFKTESNLDSTEMCSFIDWRLEDQSFYYLDPKKSPAFYDAFYNHANIKGRKNIDRDIAAYVLSKFYEHFEKLIDNEKMMAARLTTPKTWKRPTIEFREKCDKCLTYIFNGHFACPKCAYVICGDCHDSLQNGGKYHKVGKTNKKNASRSLKILIV
jgi:hypothetical protein